MSKIKYESFKVKKNKEYEFDQEKEQELIFTIEYSKKKNKITHLILDSTLGNEIDILGIDFFNIENKCLKVAKELLLLEYCSKDIIEYQDKKYIIEIFC